MSHFVDIVRGCPKRSLIRHIYGVDSLSKSNQGEQMTNGHEYDQSGVYEIRVKGRLEASWSDWFYGFEIKPTNGETLLVGEVQDQSALHGLLTKLAELGLTLISVMKINSEKD
jgi:hypothetical protein